MRSFATGFLTVADVTAADLTRSAELVEQYADLPLGGTDACLVALAERLGIGRQRRWTIRAWPDVPASAIGPDEVLVAANL